MTEKQAMREGVIQSLVGLLRTTPFTVELKVVKKPKGIKIIQEVTQEQMDAIAVKMKKKED